MRPELREACNAKGETALILAARLGHLSACKLLVSLRADVEATDSSGGTPLTHAAHGKHKEVCQLLLDHGADIEAIDCGVRSTGSMAVSSLRHLLAAPVPFTPGAENRTYLLSETRWHQRATVLVVFAGSWVSAFLGWHACTNAGMKARAPQIQRRFLGDMFGEAKEESRAEPPVDEVFEDEPGRGGPYAPAGFDTRRMQFEIDRPSERIYQECVSLLNEERHGGPHTTPLQVRYPHPALRQENEDIKTFDRRLRTLADNLFATLYATGDGIGLAAPQVGINLRVMVYNPNPRTRDDETVFVNPQIKALGNEKDYQAEGCLSFPRIRGPVQRSTWVEVEAVDWDGNPFERRIDGFEARLFLHEYDHLDGIVFTDRLGEASRKKVEPDLEFFVKEGLSFDALGLSEPMQLSCLTLFSFPVRMKPDLINYNSIAGNCQVGNEWQKTMLLLSNAPGFDDVALNYMAKAAAGGAHWQAAMELGNAGVLLGCTAALSACSQVKAAVVGLQDHLRDPKLATWMLSKLARALPVGALQLLHVLHEHGLQLNVYHASAALTACERAGLWPEAFALMEGMRHKTVCPNQLSFGAAISACGRLGLWLRALQLVNGMERGAWSIPPDAISFSACISACEKGSEWQSSLSFLKTMASKGAEPNTLSCSGAVSACEKASGSLWHVALSLSVMASPDVVSHSATISACEKAAKWALCLELLLLSPSLRLVANLVTYNAAISACDRQSQWESTILLLAALASQLLKPDLLSFNAALSACRCQPCARILLHDMEGHSLEPDTQQFHAMSKQDCWIK
eukprot:g27355.t1